MPINKYDRRPNNYDLSFQGYVPTLPQIEWGAWDQALGKTQEGITNANLLSAQMPNALPTAEDQALFQQYKQTVDQGLKEVTDTYANQGIRAGQAAQNQFLKTVKDDWLPGGKAALLNSRYANYTKAVEDLDKFRKDDVRGINSKYAQYQLQSQLAAPIGYDPVKRTGRGITSPEMYKDAELRKNATEALKGIQEDGNTQFFAGMDGQRAAGWITKVQNEGRSEEKLKLVMQAMMEMPEYSSQLDRDTAVQLAETDPNLAKKQYSNQVDQNLNNYKSMYEKAKNSKDPKQVRDFQAFLSRQGYSVAQDGNLGNETTTQADKFIQDLSNDAEAKKSNFNVETYTRKNIEDSYLDYAGGFANQKIKKDLIVDKVYLQKQKIAADRANTQALIASNEKFLPQKADDTSVVPSQPVQLGNFVQALDKGKQTQTQAYQTAEQIKAQDPMFKGWKNEDIVAAYREFENVAKANPGANPNDLKAMFNQRFSNYLQGQGNTGVPGADLFEYVSQGRNSPTIASIDNLWSADESVNSMSGLISNYGNTYATTTEGQTNIQRMRSAGYGEGMNDTQLIQDIVNNPIKYQKSGRTNSVVAGAYLPSNSTFDYGNSFVSTMSKDIAKLSTVNPDLFKDKMSGSAILQGKGDEFLVPVLERYGEDINNGAYGNYVSEGGQGLLFYKMQQTGEGREGAGIDPGTFKYESMAVDLDENGKTVIVYSGKGKNGKTEVPAYTRMTPTAYQIGEIKQGLAGQLAMANQSGDYQKQLEIGKKILGLEDANWSNYRNFDVAGQKLSERNTSEEVILQKNNDGSTTPMRGFRFSNDKIQNRFTDGEYTFETEIVHAWSPYSRESKTLNVQVVRDKPLPGESEGRIVAKIAMPSQQGTLDYGSAANVIINNKNKEILSTIPVEMTTTKIPEGNYIESPVNSRRLKSN